MINAWRQRAAREGIVYTQINFNFPIEDDEVIVNAYEKAITPKTKLLHITHMVNWSGQLMPVKKIAKMAHTKGIEVLVDGGCEVGGRGGQVVSTATYIRHCEQRARRDLTLQVQMPIVESRHPIRRVYERDTVADERRKPLRVAYRWQLAIGEWIAQQVLRGDAILGGDHGSGVAVASRIHSAHQRNESQAVASADPCLRVRAVRQANSWAEVLRIRIV